MKSQRKLNDADRYYIRVFNIMFRAIPLVAGIAALTFTCTKISGDMPDTKVITIIIFDIICAGYFVLAHYLLKIGIVKDGAVDERLLSRARTLLVCCLLVQWNLITYTSPTRDLWVTATFYFLLSAVLLNSKTVLQTGIGLWASMAVSRILLGDQVLPVRNEEFFISLMLRYVTLGICFAFTYIITLNAERLLGLAARNAATLEDQNEKLETMSRDIIEFTADLIEQRDSTSGTHVRRVKEYTGILAREVAVRYPEYGLTEEIVDEIVQASVLHDVGKIMISDMILLKPGKLTPEEFDEIKQHTVYGETIVDKLPESVESSFRHYGKEIAAGHHEKYDGRGYPKGLQGDDIPISAQIVSVADCFDALTTDRPYKKAYTPETALEMLRDGQCGVFSDRLMQCLDRCEERFTAVCIRYAER